LLATANAHKCYFSWPFSAPYKQKISQELLRFCVAQSVIFLFVVLMEEKRERKKVMRGGDFSIFTPDFKRGISYKIK